MACVHYSKILASTKEKMPLPFLRSTFSSTPFFPSVLGGLFHSELSIKEEKKGNKQRFYPFINNYTYLTSNFCICPYLTSSVFVMIRCPIIDRSFLLPLAYSSF